MARERDWDRDEELDDWEQDDEEDEYEEDGEDSAVEPCPYCGKDVYEGAELCPHCKNYISEDDSPPPNAVGRFPRWLVIVIVLALVAVFSGVITMW